MNFFIFIFLLLDPLIQKEKVLRNYLCQYVSISCMSVLSSGQQISRSINGFFQKRCYIKLQVLQGQKLREPYFSETFLFWRTFPKTFIPAGKWCIKVFFMISQKPHVLQLCLKMVSTNQIVGVAGSGKNQLIPQFLSMKFVIKGRQDLRLLLLVEYNQWCRLPSHIADFFDHQYFWKVSQFFMYISHQGKAVSETTSFGWVW